MSYNATYIKYFNGNSVLNANVLAKVFPDSLKKVGIKPFQNLRDVFAVQDQK